MLTYKWNLVLVEWQRRRNVNQVQYWTNHSYPIQSKFFSRTRGQQKRTNRCQHQNNTRSYDCDFVCVGSTTNVKSKLCIQVWFIAARVCFGVQFYWCWINIPFPNVLNVRKINLKLTCTRICNGVMSYVLVLLFPNIH